jgi:urease accessory protein UreF
MKPQSIIKALADIARDIERTDKRHGMERAACLHEAITMIAGLPTADEAAQLMWLRKNSSLVVNAMRLSEGGHNAATKIIQKMNEAKNV